MHPFKTPVEIRKASPMSDGASLQKSSVPSAVTVDDPFSLGVVNMMCTVTLATMLVELMRSQSGSGEVVVVLPPPQPDSKGITNIEATAVAKPAAFGRGILQGDMDPEVLHAHSTDSD